MIAKIYYTIWSDCIKQIQSVPASKSHWKIYSLTTMSLVMGVNLMFLTAVLPNNILANYIFYFEFDLFKGDTLDTLFGGFIRFMLPMLLINYFLVFRNNRYKTFIGKHPSYNGKFFLKYLLVSLWIPFALLILGMLYVKIFY